MSEYIIQHDTLVEIADAVRTIAGTEATLTPSQITTNVQNANTEVENQTTLLAQAIAALEGKTAGGSAAPVLQNKTITPTISSQTVTPDSGYDGLARVTVNAIPSNYEDVTDETEIYTDSLDELESVINSLPEAGGSASSGVSIETCTVVVTVTYPLYGASATCYENGEFIPIAISASQSNQALTINNVVCGSCVTVADCIPSAMPGYTVENAELIQASDFGISGNSSYPVYPFKITAAAGETATITIYDND